MRGVFNPSRIVNEIYNIMDDYETEGIDLYNYGVCDAIADYFDNYEKIEYVFNVSEWPNEEGGVCGIAFVEKGHPQLVLFDYKY